MGYRSDSCIHITPQGRFFVDYDVPLDDESPIEISAVYAEGSPIDLYDFLHDYVIEEIRQTIERNERSLANEE